MQKIGSKLNNMWWIISKPDCSWCDKAKGLILERGEGYTEYDYTDHPMLVKLMKRAGLDTVPQLWCGTQYVGGYEDMKKWFEDDT